MGKDVEPAAHFSDADAIRSRRLLGYTLVVLGTLAQPALFAGWLIGTVILLVNAYPNLLLFLVYFIMTAVLGRFAGPVVRICRRLVNYGRRHLTSTVSSIEQLDNAPFVLYLRSFDDDVARQEMDWADTGDQFTFFTNIFSSIRTHEEQIVTALRPAGFVVTVGRPRERLPYTGAQRIYLHPRADWQDTIADLMEKARLVVLAVGFGPGLVWEFQHAIQNVPPSRLVLLVPTDFESYAQFRHIALARGDGQVQSFLPDRLPEHREGLLKKGWIILFGDDWTPTPVRIALPHPGFAFIFKQTERSVSRALRPTIRRLVPLGDDYDRERRSAAVVGGLLGAISVVLASIVIREILLANIVQVPVVVIVALSIVLPILGVFVGATLNVLRVMRRYGERW